MADLKDEMPLPELLSPAGSLRALTAAVDAGCDAVYFGGREYSARAYAGNFDLRETAYAVDLCRDRGVKTYVTMNTEVFDRELSGWLSFAEFLIRRGVSALIVTDIGAASELRRRFPEAVLHASTQAGVSDTASARLMRDLGFSRVVLSRELPLRDIREIVSESGIETEMFIHGALCVSVSGQCLMSSMIGGRSGNRGECAQPCRLPYCGRCALSLKDCCLARRIPEIISSGVTSLKIEGRMKSPDYVYEVTRIYRKLLDERRACTEEEYAQLLEVFSRSGFTDAYFTGKSRDGMCGTRPENVPEFRIRDRKFDAAVPGGYGDASLSLPEEKKPEFPVIAKKNESVMRAAFRSCAVMKKIMPALPRGTEAVLPLGEFVRYCRKKKDGDTAPCGVVIPSAFFDSERKELSGLLGEAKGYGAAYAVTGSWPAVCLAKEHGMPFVADIGLNVVNTLSAALLYGMGARDVILSAELIPPQIRDINRRVPSSLFAYGRVPVMLLTKCVMKELWGCPDGGCVYGTLKKLKDRTGADFPVTFEYGHRNIVFNSVPTYAGQDLETAGRNAGIYMLFTDETPDMARRVAESLAAGVAIPWNTRRPGMKKPKGGVKSGVRAPGKRGAGR